MPNVAQVIKEEITRLARKEVRAAVNPLKKQVRVLRNTVKDQQAMVAKLEKAVHGMAGQVADPSPSLFAPEEEPSRARVTPSSVRRHRLRLRLSQVELGGLLGVNATTIVRWEAGSSMPRVQHRTALIRLRELGVREVRSMLEE